MTDIDDIGDASEVAVVAGGGGATSWVGRWVVIGLGAILIGGAGFALASGGGGGNTAVIVRDDGSLADDTTTVVEMSTTNAAPPYATLEPRTADGSSTTTTEGHVVDCDVLISMIGLSVPGVVDKLSICGWRGGFSGDYIIVTMSEPCAPDPSQAGIIESQRPSAGFPLPPLADLPMRVEVDVYQDCSLTVPQTDFVPPSFIGTWPSTIPEPTTSEPTTTETTGP